MKTKMLRSDSRAWRLTALGIASTVGFCATNLVSVGYAQTALVPTPTAAPSCGCNGVPTIADMQRAGEAAPGTVWVDSLDLTKMSIGWQKPLASKSVGGNALMLKGDVYPHGIGTHAVSQMAIDVDRAMRFVAMVGLDDEVADKGSLVFQVFSDGKLVYTSGPMTGADRPSMVSVDLTGVKQMVLRVTDADDGVDSDHADWAGAMLVYPAGHIPNPQSVNAPLLFTPGTEVDDETPIAIAPSSVDLPQTAIHGPLVTGATPGRPFLFRIPATGEGVLKYSAKNLPQGVSLDSQTGIISGALAKEGTTVVHLRVEGSKGVAKRDLTIVAGTHKLAQTPPMGWNSWNIYYCGVDEAKVRAATDWMVKTGLDRHGYQYVNIDDCWQGERDAGGNIQVNPKFGDMKALGDYIHSKGLKYGIYSSPGPKTCAGHEGSWQHEAQDVASYSNWGVDYLKHDWCSYTSVATGEGLARAKKPYIDMRKALDGASRDIVYSLCQYGGNDVWKWGNDPDVAGNLWRTTGDIAPRYGSMISIGIKQPDHSPFAGPGHWNDPDMLFMHALKPNEQITHLTMWSMLAAPLLIGSDISTLPRFSLDALSNDEMIAIDQDPLGKGASVVSKLGLTEVWSRPLWDGTRAVAFINRGFTKIDMQVKWKDLGFKGKQTVRDVWQEKDLGKYADGFNAMVPAHGALMFKIGRPNAKQYRPG